MEPESDLERFYWLVPGCLAGCSRPGGRHATGLDEDLQWLKEQGIGAVISLTESPLPSDALQRHNLEALNLPVPDLTPPLPGQIHRALDSIDWLRANGVAVAVHCLMGQGRTGTVLAAYLIRSGMSAGQAIVELRSRCPGALDNPSQEAALRCFATRRDWIL